MIRKPRSQTEANFPSGPTRSILSVLCALRWSHHTRRSFESRHFISGPCTRDLVSISKFAFSLIKPPIENLIDNSPDGLVWPRTRQGAFAAEVGVCWQRKVRRRLSQSFLAEEANILASERRGARINLHTTPASMFINFFLS